MYRVFNIATGSLVVMLLLLNGTAAAGPKLICEEPLYNFGEREKGESVAHTFIIKNVGDAPAEMKKFKPRCGCAVLNTVQDKVAPGAETAITLKVSLGKRLGQVRKGITIVSKDGKQDPLKLMFKGVVTSTLIVVPEQVALGRVDADKEVTRSVTVAFAQEEPVKVTRIVSDMDAVVPEVKTLRDGGLYRVTVRIKPVKGSSKIQARVCLYTDSVKHPIVYIPITGVVAGGLIVTPSKIVLAGSPDLPVVRYIVIVSPRNKPFNIIDVQCPTASVKAEVKPMGIAGYRIELSGLTASSDLDGKCLLVKTSVSSVPIIQIPLHVRRPTVSLAEFQVQASGRPGGAP